MAKKDLYLLLFIITALFSLGWVSCEPKEPECYQPINVTVISGFVQRDTVKYIDTLPGGSDTFVLQYNTTRLLNPGMYTLDVDSIYSIIGGPNGEDHLSVPLNPRADSMRYRFLSDTTVKSNADTFTFYYTSSVHFISNDCGYTNFYKLDSVRSTRHLVDSIALISSEVTNDQTNAVRHIQLYFFK